MENCFKEVVLEQSTNTHTFRAKTAMNKPAVRFADGSVLVDAPGSVLHGEHGPIGTEGPCLKVNQTELNPVTQALQHAFD